MRWLAVLVVSAIGVALAAAGLFLLRDDGPEELLPDLDQAAPAELEIVEEGDSYRLVFSSAVDNVGRGPLLIDGERPDRETPALAVSQLVRRTDGSTRAREVPGEIRYARDGDTRPLAPARLRGLRAPQGRRRRPRAARAGRRASVSATGTRRRRAREVEGKPAEAVWIDECGRDQPGLLTAPPGDLTRVRGRLRAGPRGPVRRRHERPRRQIPARAQGEPRAGHPGGELREQRRLRAHPAAPVRGHPHRPRSRTLPERRDVPARPGNRLRLRSR